MNMVKSSIISLLLMISVAVKGNDTIPCIILYSDTAVTELVGTDENGEDFYIYDIDPSVYQMKALYVPQENLWMDMDKSPLPSTIVIWQVKYLYNKKK